MPFVVRFLSPCRFSLPLLAALLLYGSLLAGCVAATHDQTISQRPATDTSRLTLFVNEKNPTGPDLDIAISSVEIRSDGAWRQILPEPMQLNSSSSPTGQIFLTRADLPPAVYDGLRLTITQAFLLSDGNESPEHNTSSRNNLVLDTSIYEETFPEPLALHAGESPSMFLYWDTEKSIAKAGSFTPVFFTVRQDINLTRDLLLASCPEIDTVYMVRTDTNRVAGSFGISGHPTWMSLLPNNRDLLVLSTDPPVLNTVELASGQVRERIHITMMRDPVRLAVDPEGQFAYLVGDDNLVMAVNLATGGQGANQRHGNRLDFLLHLKDRQQLAVLSDLSQEMLLLGTQNLNQITTVRIGPGAMGLAATDHYLFHAEPLTRQIVRYDMTSGESKGRHMLPANALLIHGSSLFGAARQSPSIYMMDYEVMGAVRTIEIASIPDQMAVSAERQWLYASSTEKTGISVVDLGSRAMTAVISLHAATLGLVIRD